MVLLKNLCDITHSLFLEMGKVSRVLASPRVDAISVKATRCVACAGYLTLLELTLLKFLPKCLLCNVPRCYGTSISQGVRLSLALLATMFCEALDLPQFCIVRDE